MSHTDALQELRRDLMRFEALPPQSPEAVWDWAQKANAHIHDLLRSTSAPQTCPEADKMGAWACTNKAQCWEPCGDLGHSKEHTVVVPETPRGDTAKGKRAVFEEWYAKEGSDSDSAMQAAWLAWCAALRSNGDSANARDPLAWDATKKML